MYAERYFVAQVNLIVDGYELRSFSLSNALDKANVIDSGILYTRKYEGVGFDNSSQWYTDKVTYLVSMWVFHFIYTSSHSLCPDIATITITDAFLLVYLQSMRSYQVWPITSAVNLWLSHYSFQPAKCSIMLRQLKRTAVVHLLYILWS